MIFYDSPEIQKGVLYHMKRNEDLEKRIQDFIEKHGDKPHSMVQTIRAWEKYKTMTDAEKWFYKLEDYGKQAVYDLYHKGGKK